MHLHQVDILVHAILMANCTKQETAKRLLAKMCLHLLDMNVDIWTWVFDEIYYKDVSVTNNENKHFFVPSCCI